MPARGRGVTASQKPISEYDRRRGDRIGHHWWAQAFPGDLYPAGVGREDSQAAGVPALREAHQHL